MQKFHGWHFATCLLTLVPAENDFLGWQDDSGIKSAHCSDYSQQPDNSSSMGLDALFLLPQPQAPALLKNKTKQKPETHLPSPTNLKLRWRSILAASSRTSDSPHSISPSFSLPPHPALTLSVSQAGSNSMPFSSHTFPPTEKAFGS